MGTHFRIGWLLLRLLVEQNNTFLNIGHVTPVLTLWSRHGRTRSLAVEMR